MPSERNGGLAGDLRRIVDGEVADSPDAVRPYASDYGQVVHKVPGVVVRPRHAEDVRKVVGFAARHGVAVTGRGSGHSLRGQSLSDGGIVLDLKGLDRLREVSEDRLRFSAEAGVQWRRVIGATVPRGLVPPVLTGYPHVTLGGTLSTVGWGTGSFRHGAQIDNCLSLEVVTGSGDLVVCGPDESPELFFHALGGLGQFGIITGVTHRLRRCGPLVRTYLLAYEGLAELLDDADAIVAAGLADHLEGQLTLEEEGAGSRWRYRIALSVETGEPEAEGGEAVLAALRHGRVERVSAVPAESFFGDTPRMDARPGVSHPWMHTFVPRSRALEHIQFCIEHMPFASLGVKGVGGKVLLSMGVRSTTRMPMLRVPEEESFVLFAVSPIIDRSMLPAAAAYLSRVSDLGMRVGARRHLGTWVHFDQARWRLHFGEYWERLNEVKRRCDPYGILAPGVIDFEAEAQPV